MLYNYIIDYGTQITNKFVSVINLSVGTSSTITEKYYEELIRQRTAEAESYNLPTTNDEFKPGVQSKTTHDYGSYDFVIVGGGSAGSVLATRLSEIDSYKILLLEAGGEEDDFSQIPSMFFHLFFSKMNWGYFSTPQTTCCLGMKNRACAVPRGKALGGSSAINAMMYARGNRYDFDEWVELGNPGWSYEEVLPYFIKSENSQVDGDPDYHGKTGFWNVAYTSPASPLLSKFFNASLQMNQPIVDYNGRKQIGSGRVQFTIKRGKRQSTGKAFLDNARQRRNLEVKSNVLVTKIIIDKTKVAKGVEFVTKHKKFFVKAKKEVIVSAGVVNSPQLLMLSGIGPKDHLKALEIGVVEDLPVGMNLREHALFPGLVYNTNYTLSNRSTEEFVKQYLKGLGTYTRAAGIDGIGFIHTGQGNRAPTIEYLFVPPTGIKTKIVSKAFNYNDNLSNNFLNKLDPQRGVVIHLILLHPKSRGRITLKSNDPLDFPYVDLNMLSEQEDIDTVIEGIEFIRDIFQSDAFKKIDARPLEIPVCKELRKQYREYWECVIRQMTTTIYHPHGTTAMGPDKKTSVVDGDLKVHGIQKLRVVDAGIFPTSPSGHLNAPTVMVAEKIADIIKRKYRFS
ncbi:glucose dehydrogenase [FAD, quinone]-like isoform X2 [Zophobas morio]|uniref:glucose dehydrogenase [FAD, quinone]-like isoform X2 n=1 Tax=Zophobas morio TaxID=2755281 RepID=UPI0030839B77